MYVLIYDGDKPPKLPNLTASQTKSYGAVLASRPGIWRSSAAC
jgi:hypothetical protein